MKENENLSQRFVNFIGGKGFYIVLFACLTVIGVSAGVIFYTGEGEEDYVQFEDWPAGAVMPDAPVSSVPEPEDTPVMNPIEVPEEPEALPEPVKPVKPTPAQKPEPVAEAPKEATHKAEEKTPEPLVFIRPVSGSIAVEYSPDALIYNRTMGDWRVHSGIDIEADIGTKVLACANGTVTDVYADDLYGTVVTIDHGEGLVSLYANLAATPTVKPGDAVTVSSVIGSVGNTALCETGEVQHLHFAMLKDGKPVDPMDYLPR
ncbi:MAG: peptidoglycan DD-metalloendopeptidase family protein [Oscillospiraceae bacterium]|nr:peptidoglycan DD-metalloendopeptidase family protein [Oscillospiraceae bacterium]